MKRFFIIFSWFFLIFLYVAPARAGEDEKKAILAPLSEETPLVGVFLTNFPRDFGALS